MGQRNDRSINPTGYYITPLKSDYNSLITRKNFLNKERNPNDETKTNIIMNSKEGYIKG